MTNLIKELEQEQLKTDLPDFAVGDTVRVQVKVKEVLGYGASTQPLALDKILSLSIPESLDTLMLEKLSAGDTFSAVIKKMPAMMGSDRNKENWNRTMC